jgi:hypothetical protein
VLLKAICILLLHEGIPDVGSATQCTNLAVKTP